MRDHGPAFEEITNWVMSHRRTHPATILSALVGNAVALARSLGISREGFLRTAGETWDHAVERAKQRPGAS